MPKIKDVELACDKLFMGNEAPRFAKSKIDASKPKDENDLAIDGIPSLSKTIGHVNLFVYKMLTHDCHTILQVMRAQLCIERCSRCFYF